MGIERLLDAIKDNDIDIEMNPLEKIPILILREEKIGKPEDLILREKVKLTYPNHNIELIPCKYSRIGEALIKISKVAQYNPETYDIVLIQGDEEREKGYLTRKNLKDRISDVLSIR